MHDLFDAKNWNDFLHDDSLMTILAFVLVGTGLLLTFLYSDRISRWKADRQERIKWMYWNRG